MGTNTNDKKIIELHQLSLSKLKEIKKIIDELKGLGDHSLDGNNALLNIREHLSQLSQR